MEGIEDSVRSISQLRKDYFAALAALRREKQGKTIPPGESCEDLIEDIAEELKRRGGMKRRLYRLT